MHALLRQRAGMTMVTEFFLPVLPPTSTHQEKQVHVVNGKPVFYEPAEVKAARQKLRAHLGRHVPAEVFIGPVRLTTWWCFPASGRHRNGEYRASRPDTDNLVKLLKDVMTELHFWKDDAQVASEVTEKYWADIPGIYVKVESL
jgi:Holliday junction resolvase RusA-like endonuclease